jgi:hypothetical protein
MTKTDSMRKKIFTTDNIIFGFLLTPVFILLVFSYFLLVHPVVSTNNLRLKSSCGMYESDISAALGKPDYILSKKDYDELAKLAKAENEHGLQLPVVNKVYIYEKRLFPIGDFYYINFDKDNKVCNTYLATGDFYPFYQNYLNNKYRVSNEHRERRN